MLTLLILPLLSHAFNFNEDTLCFKNADPQMADAAPAPWGSYAVKTGACQGIAGLSAAFSAHAEFNKNLSKPQTNEEVREIISRIIYNHHQGMIEIPGYKNLKEFCVDFKSEFLRAAVLFNRNIATHEIAAVLPEFVNSQGKILNHADQVHVLNTLNGFEAKLLAGKLPVLLYFKHAILVYEMKRATDAILLTVYDSNFIVPREMKFTLDQKGLPDLTNKMIWDITPER